MRILILIMLFFLPVMTNADITVPTIDEIENREASESRCQYYAKAAVEQNEINKKQSCGLSGVRWNNDNEGQYQWCLTVAEHISQSESVARGKELNSCLEHKVDSSNLENQPAIPSACHSPDSAIKPVKRLYRSFRYEKKVIEPISGGVIGRFNCEVHNV